MKICPLQPHRFSLLLVTHFLFRYIVIITLKVNWSMYFIYKKHYNKTRLNCDLCISFVSNKLMVDQRVDLMAQLVNDPTYGAEGGVYLCA